MLPIAISAVWIGALGPLRPLLSAPTRASLRLLDWKQSEIATRPPRLGLVRVKLLIARTGGAQPFLFDQSNCSPRSRFATRQGAHLAWWSLGRELILMTGASASGPKAAIAPSRDVAEGQEPKDARPPLQPPHSAGSLNSRQSTSCAFAYAPS